ncbi:ATP-binding protein [Mucilaginibacter paludis]|uniref:histidine kinase n=1 Tax=Mucilaginibacter paludis DSM 18603 TaxID=714943 RepID=H1Y012_9SPHI|nr:ATP-binding protein [Mucilaginibacter paludis]EHQ27854.1 integral membrane sensor hybrid histidine kinase [Mucilaginibacter paludis DSM 18603]
MNITRYFNNKFQGVLSREQDTLSKARIRILAQAILAFMFLCVAIIIFSLITHRITVAIRMAIFLILFATTLGLLLSKVHWRITGHLFLVCITLLIWSNALIFRQGVTLITVQYTILVITGGYYILDAKWGLIYSLASIIPVIVLIILQYFLDYRFPTQTINSNQYAFVFVLVFNFILLVFIHYHFFKAFRKSNLREQKLKQHLEQALKAAEELAAAKTNFLSTMSHELRTPLNAVIGMTNILSIENRQPEQIENLEILRFSAANLMAIINDILDFNKIDAGSVKLENHEFSPGELLKNVFGAFRAKAVAKEIGFNYLPDLTLNTIILKGDAIRLTQILFNLLENAVKFTQSGYISFQVESSYNKPAIATIRFVVADTGIGIPLDKQAKIFDPFVQESSETSRQYHGTGLGLTIVNRLLALHNSKLNFTSQEGQGTTFSFELNYPIVIPEINGIVQTEKNSISIARMKILIAEDNAINVIVLKKLLKNWDIFPDVADNGQQAVDAYRHSDYDVILMDINMPVMDGFEAAKTIKEMHLDKRDPIPIIAVTASIGTDVERLSSNPYLDDYLFKPFEPENLKEKLENIMRAKSKNN